MGISYQIILCDEFDWGYLNTSKEKHLKEFQKEYLKAGAYQCDLIAQWPHYAVAYAFNGRVSEFKIDTNTKAEAKCTFTIHPRGNQYGWSNNT